MTKRAIVTIDCETDPFKRGRMPAPFLWGMYDGERYRDFPDAEPLIKYLSTQNVIAYAHNGGKFDFCFLFQYLEPYTDMLVIHGRLARFKIGLCEFRDSWCILPTALRTFGKDNIDIGKLEADKREAHMEEIKRYNRRDCVSLYDAVTGFVNIYGSNLTLAGTAMSYWSKKFGHEKPKTDEVFYNALKPFYYGGRVQCFKKGLIEKQFHVCDINSAYPYAMTFEHPISLRFHEVESPPAKDPIYNEAFYTIQCVSRGALPWQEWKEDDNGERRKCGPLLFPDDEETRVYCISGWELNMALELKLIKNVIIAKRMDFGKTINFRDYVDHFYKLKSEAEKGSKEYIFAKLMQNSLYGKFGANPSNYVSYGIVPQRDIVETIKDPSKVIGRAGGPWSWAGTMGKFGLMAGKDPATGQNNPVESSYYNVATAASITGFVRAYLMRHLHAVREAGGTPLYCDTDSIAYILPKFLDDHPFQFDKKKLGAWTYEGSFDRGAIAGKKMYAFHSDTKDEWKVASKGVKWKASDIVRIAQGEVLEWESDAPSMSVLRRIKTGEKELPPKFLKRKSRLT